MIFDALENWRNYSALPAWQLACERLQSLGPDTQPGEYELQGRDIYLVVFDTTTKALLDTTLEAHQIYADLHLPLTGPEVHSRFPLSALTEKSPYDEARDAQCFEHPDRFTALFTLHPGTFALYLPGEAHLTQGKVDPRPQPLRKAVVKIRAELLRA
jgi:YhcH/YjgK/YiaL family protein